MVLFCIKLTLKGFFKILNNCFCPQERSRTIIFHFFPVFTKITAYIKIVYKKSSIIFRFKSKLLLILKLFTNIQCVSILISKLLVTLKLSTKILNFFHVDIRTTVKLLTNILLSKLFTKIFNFFPRLHQKISTKIFKIFSTIK